MKDRAEARGLGLLCRWQLRPCAKQRAPNEAHIDEWQAGRYFGTVKLMLTGLPLALNVERSSKPSGFAT